MKFNILIPLFFAVAQLQGMSSNVSPQDTLAKAVQLLQESTGDYRNPASVNAWREIMASCKNEAHVIKNEKALNRLKEIDFLSPENSRQVDPIRCKHIIGAEMEKEL